MIPGSLEDLLSTLMQLTEGEIDELLCILPVLAQYGIQAQNATLIILRHEVPEESEKTFELKVKETPVIDVRDLIAEERAALRRGWCIPRTIGRPCGKQGNTRRR